MPREQDKVRSRIVLTNDNPFGVDHIDSPETFNMSQRYFLNRDPDMEIKDQYGDRFRIKKEFVAGVKEVVMVEQEVEEVEVETEVSPE